MRTIESIFWRFAIMGVLATGIYVFLITQGNIGKVWAAKYYSSDPGFSSCASCLPPTPPSTCWNSWAVGATDCGDACDGGNAWTKYVEYDYFCAFIPLLSGCDWVYVRLADTCSTGDKYNAANPPVMNAGYCDCSVGGGYKTCCSGGVPVNAVPWIVDPYEPPEAYCPGGSSTNFCSFAAYPPCGAAACAVFPTPTSPPTGTPTPTPTPPLGCTLDCTYSTPDPSCPSGLTECSGKQDGISCLWETGCSTCNCVPPGATPTPTPAGGCNFGACGAGCAGDQRYVSGNCWSYGWFTGDGCYVDGSCESPPPLPNDAPSLQIILEVANIDNGESIPDDCPGAGAGWPWPANLRPLKTTTTAELGDTIELKACVRNAGGDITTVWDLDTYFWRNYAFSGDKTFADAAKPGSWISVLPGIWQDMPSGTYDYHPFHPGSDIPYDWFRRQSSGCCGTEDCSAWLFGCVIPPRTVRFELKDSDLSLLGKTVAGKAAVRMPPFVNPYDYHPYLTHCNNVGISGFWGRTPECCWGNVGDDGYPGCPIPPGDPRYDQCRYGSCINAGINEDFMYWSNLIKINIPIPPTCTVEVPDLTVPAGSTFPLYANVVVQNGDFSNVSNVNFSSPSPAGVATVSPSDDNSPPYWTQVTGVAPGTATMTTTVSLTPGGNTCQDTATITVTPPPDWFQTQGGDVHAEGEIRSLISSLVPAGSDYLSLESDEGFPGVVSANGEILLDDGQVSTKLWNLQEDLVFGLSPYHFDNYSSTNRYDYDYFLRKAGNLNTTKLDTETPIQSTLNSLDNLADLVDGYLVTSPTGDLTIPGNDNSTWMAGGAASAKKVIVFVPGDLTIRGRVRLNTNSENFLAFIVRGNITMVGNWVSDETNPSTNPGLVGIYLADGQIDTGQNSDLTKVFLGKGVFVAYDGFNLRRQSSDTINIPAEKFIYDPQLIMQAPQNLQTIPYNWQEVAP